MCVVDANMRCRLLVICLVAFVYVGSCTGETIHVPRDGWTGELVPGDAAIGERNVKQKNVSVTQEVGEPGKHSIEVARNVGDHSRTEVVRQVGNYSRTENTQQGDDLASTISYFGTGKTPGNYSLSQVFRQSRDTKGVLGVVDSVLNVFAKGKAFLERFGYIEDALAGAITHVGAIKDALKAFQDFNGLPVTGELDLATVTKMLQPRCGLPDVIKPGSRYLSVPSEYRAPGSAEMRAKWPKNDLTYRLVSYTRKLGQGQVEDAIARAFRKWSDVTPLVFRRGQGAVDINIGFTRGDHGDGSPFDRQGNVLAHAFFPGYGEIAGDTHFDDDEDWTVNSPQGVNLEIVAAHEFGHALGLEHSRHKDALMAPFYKEYDPNYKLHADDIRRIQELYGASRQRPATQRPATQRPATQRPATQRPPTQRPPTQRPPTQRPPTQKPPTQRPPTQRPATKRPANTQRPRTRPATQRPAKTQRPPRKRPPTQRPPTQRPPTQRPATQRPAKPPQRRSGSKTPRARDPREELCSLTFDAIEQVHDGRIYVFKREFMYWLTPEGVSSPRRISDVYPDAPNSPTAVVYDRVHRHLFIFRSDRYWRYSGSQKDPGYPKLLPKAFVGVTAGMQWTDGGIILFKNAEFFRWSENLSGHSSGFPRRVSEFWKGLPDQFDSVFKIFDGYIFFFKGHKYWRYDSRSQLSAGYPRDTRPYWLHCRVSSSLSPLVSELTLSKTT